jgi:ribosomal protein S18 acetylase RimI-like enzyme
MKKLSTRLATRDDVSALAPLFVAYRQFYEKPADLPLATAFLRDRLTCHESIVIVAENEEGDMLGFCQLYPTFCSLQAAAIHTLSDLFVKPEARKSGVGRALLLAAQSHAQAGGVARLDLTTAKTNRAAQSLYESLGWIRDEVFYAYNKVVVR